MDIHPSVDGQSGPELQTVFPHLGGTGVDLQRHLVLESGHGIVALVQDRVLSLARESYLVEYLEHLRPGERTEPGVRPGDTYLGLHDHLLRRRVQ